MVSVCKACPEIAKLFMLLYYFELVVDIKILDIYIHISVSVGML